MKAAKSDLHDWAERFEIIERGGRLNYIYKRDEKILAKKQATDGAGGQQEENDVIEEPPNNYFKEFEEFEKNFLSKVSSRIQRRDTGSKTVKKRVGTPTTGNTPPGGVTPVKSALPAIHSDTPGTSQVLKSNTPPVTAAIEKTGKRKQKGNSKGKKNEIPLKATFK